MTKKAKMASKTTVGKGSRTKLPSYMKKMKKVLPKEVMEQFSEKNTALEELLLSHLKVLKK